VGDTWQIAFCSINMALASKTESLKIFEKLKTKQANKASSTVSQTHHRGKAHVLTNRIDML
jgi:hypothetical protein